MKKQILILFLAVFALGATQAYAQQLPYLEPTPLTCIELNNPLFVVAGQEYTYSVNVPAPDGNKTYHWFVTRELDFLVNGELTSIRDGSPGNAVGDYLAGGSGHYDTPSEGDAHNTINLTWNSFTLDAAAGEYLFVVIYVVNDGTDGCETDNLKVYRIQTQHAFTLDIANIDVDAEALAADEFEICVDEVQGAFFNPDHGDHGGVVYDFGQNTFYYVVAAANFSGQYELSVRFTGLNGATPEGNQEQEATLYYDNDFETLLGLEAGGVELSDGAPHSFFVDAIDGEAVGAEGQMLYIKIVIDHNHFEATAETSYELAIDGILAENDVVLGDADVFGDMIDNFDEGVCDGVIYEEFAKASTQILRPRPDIQAVDPDYLPIGIP